MKEIFQTQFRIMAYIAAIFTIGTVGYYLIEEDWSLFESLYMTAITITTVGYGETKPLSDTGRAFTIILIFLGLGSAAMFASQLAKTFLERNFTDIFGVNKMKKQIEKIKDHYIVCGFGDIGSTISSALDDAEIPFVVIESNNQTAEFAIQRHYLVVQGKATYDTTLLQAGIDRASGIVICLGDDSINMHVSLAARELNPDVFIVTRAYKAHVEKRMIRAGANSVVNPLKMGGQQFANLITRKYQGDSRVEGSVSARTSVMGYELKLYQHFQATPISVQEVMDKVGGHSALEIRKLDGEEHDSPALDTLLQPHETILMLVREKDKTLLIPDEMGTNADLFSWSEDYLIGIPHIDEQHMRLFELANDFMVALGNGRGKERLSRTFDALTEYATVHFQAEEKLFEEWGYPDAEDHAREHADLVEKVLAFNHNREFIFPDNIGDFLSFWLKDHILGSDMDYARFHKSQRNDLLTV